MQGLPKRFVCFLQVGSRRVLRLTSGGDVGFVLVMAAPFALLAAWRTAVHARKVIDEAASGWLAVAEAAAVGLASAGLYLLPGVVGHPLDAMPYLSVYGGAAGAIGAVVGAWLRLSGLAVLRGVMRIGSN